MNNKLTLLVVCIVGIAASLYLEILKSAPFRALDTGKNRGSNQGVSGVEEIKLEILMWAHVIR